MKKTTPIQVVLFDLGNVLVDLGGVSTMHKMLNTQGEESEVWIKWLNSPSVAAFDTGKISFDEFTRRLPEEVGSDIDPAVFKASFRAWPKGLFEGALDLVASVKPGLHRAILSNTNAAHWDRLMLEMGLAGQFHSYFASHHIGAVKPDVEIYQHVLQRLKVAPEQILFIDDNQVNVDTALKLGIQAHRVKGVEQATELLMQFNVLQYPSS
ncbi:HAD family hydrolase [Marinomonas epiphytica]